MAPIWLWRPRMLPPKAPVDEEQYRCCCYAMPTPTGFSVYNYAFAALQLFTLIMIMTAGARPAPPYEVIVQMWVNIVLWGGVTVLGIVAARTQRPFYMQIYLVITTMIYAVGFYFSSTLMVHTWSQVRKPGLHLDEVEAEITFNLARHRVANMDRYRMIYYDYYFMGQIITLGMTMITIVWQTQMTYSFYFYVRDRQLEIEEKERQTILVKNAQLLAKCFPEKDVEKQELEPMLMPPPPYEP